MSVRILAWGPLKYVYTEQLHTRGPRLGPQHARENFFFKYLIFSVKLIHHFILQFKIGLDFFKFSSPLCGFFSTRDILIYYILHGYETDCV